MSAFCHSHFGQNKDVSVSLPETDKGNEKNAMYPKRNQPKDAPIFAYSPHYRHFNPTGKSHPRLCALFVLLSCSLLLIILLPSKHTRFGQRSLNCDMWTFNECELARLIYGNFCIYSMMITFNLTLFLNRDTNLPWGKHFSDIFYKVVFNFVSLYI